jgi:hypothetical protein
MSRRWYCQVTDRFFLSYTLARDICFFVDDRGRGGESQGHENCHYTYMFMRTFLVFTDPCLHCQETGTYMIIEGLNMTAWEVPCTNCGGTGSLRSFSAV